MQQKLSFPKLILGGVIAYAVMFLLWSAFMAYGFAEGSAPKLIGLAALVVTLMLLSKNAGLQSPMQALPYAVGWAIVIFLLDVLLSVPFTGWALFSDWNVWVGYALVVVVPLVYGARETLASTDEHIPAGPLL